MKLILLAALVLGFHSLSKAGDVVASIVTKMNNQLVMISDAGRLSSQNWNLNQVPFNSLKNLLIKGAFLTEQKAILVFDLDENAVIHPIVATETFVMTAQGSLVAAVVVPEFNAIKVKVTAEGDLVTVTSSDSLAKILGKMIPMNQNMIDVQLFLNERGQVVTTAGLDVGRAQGLDGSVVSLVTDLNGQIATLEGAGSEIVVTGERKEFLKVMDLLQSLNAQHKQNSQWLPVTDLKISDLSSVVQIEFRNSFEEESFGSFKFVSPLVINHIKENQASN